MTTSAYVNADSVGPNGCRLVTMVVTFPRFVLPEFNTHRMFSRNGASSRAIPVAKQIEQVKSAPFVPTAFNKNSKGMQGGAAIDADLQQVAKDQWLKAAESACQHAEALQAMGIAKQYVNRILEPFLYTTMVVTGTADAYSNFFALRYHKDAQPEIQELAIKMWEAYDNSVPEYLTAGQWHLPFVTSDEKKEWKKNNSVSSSDEAWYPLLVKSVARCARVSYLNHDKTVPSFEDDSRLYTRLIGAVPGHFSPLEHQAQALSYGEVSDQSGNLRKWKQYRKTIANEYITEFKGSL